MRQPPSRWYYGLSALVALAGIAFFTWLVWWQVNGVAGDLQRVIVPGSTDVTVRHPGKYFIYHEYRDVEGDRLFSTTPGIAGLRVTLTDKSSQKPVALKPAGVTTSYSLGGHDAVAVLEFQAATEGTFTLAASYPDGARSPLAVLAVGPAFGGRLAAVITGGVVLLLLTLGVGIWLALLTYNRRRLRSA